MSLTGKSLDEQHRTLVGVLTTVFEPREAAKAFATKMSNNYLVVVEDQKGPSEYDIPGAKLVFLSSEDQIKSSAIGKPLSDFGATMPWNHFGRKNLGYLKAIQLGACLIWDFDDDNVLSVGSLQQAITTAVAPHIPERLSMVYWGYALGVVTKHGHCQ